MESYSVVEYLNIFEYFVLSFLPRFKVAVMNQFCFQGMKKAFSDRIIPAISLTSHALYHTMLFQDFTVTVRGILTPSISMPD
jgi:hypothetical protein